MITLIQQTNWYQNKIFDVKPFNCTMCLTFWLTLGIFVSVYGIIGIPYAAFTALSAEFLDRKLNNL